MYIARPRVGDRGSEGVSGCNGVGGLGCGRWSGVTP